MPSANPAPGWRDSGVRSTDAGDTLHSVGNTGHCWASAITGSDVDFLAFDPNWLHPQYYYSRGYGRQLRCLQVPLGTRTGPAGCNLHCPRAGGTWSNNSRCLTKFLLQQSRAGRAIPTNWNWPRAGRAPRARGERAMLRIAGA